MEVSMKISTEVTHNNLIADFVADKRSDNTKRAYRKDLEDFFKIITGRSISQEVVLWFINSTFPLKKQH